MRREQVNVGGVTVSYLTEGAGWPLLLLHGAWENAVDWHWVLPELAQRYLVLAPDLPGTNEDDLVSDKSPDYYAGFIGQFLDALGLHQAILVGNSLGGLAAIRFAATTSDRVAAVVLVDSVGLGPEISPIARMPALPGVGESMMLWAMTPWGAMQRTWSRACLYFAHPSLAPSEWLAEQNRLARRPRFLSHWLDVYRSIIGPQGQRVVVLDQLDGLEMPSLVVWGEQDRALPVSQGQEAAKRLPQGQLALISDCGHLPQLERPDEFVHTVSSFLAKAVV
jgi:pimeloyl-ACP methyl ester carboxylesterase